MPNKQELEQLYVIDELSSVTIGEIYRVDGTTVLRWLRNFGIAIRPRGKGSSKSSKMRKQTNLDKYGVDNPSKSNHVKKKKEATCLRNYGVKYHNQSKCGQEQRVQTYLKKFGVSHHMKNSESKNRCLTTLKQSVKEKYGVDSILKLAAVQEKVRNTNLEKYGVRYPLENTDIQQKAKQTTEHKYQVKNYSQIQIPKDVLDQLSNRDVMFDIYQDNTVADIANSFGVCTTTVLNYLRKHQIDIQYHHAQSSIEREISDFISSFGFDVQQNNRDVLSRQELDIYVPSANLAIEVDGIFWHSELNGKGPTYHYDKTIQCLDQGIQLIHIWDSEWKTSSNIIKSRIQNALGVTANKIGARQCSIVSVSKSDKREFYQKTHTQGTAATKIDLGLEYDGELVAMMSFGHSRYKKNCQWELTRFSNALNTTVVGGAQKLFNYFVQMHQPNSIIAYADRRWGEGHMYLNLGFNYSHSSKPNYWYTKDHINLLSRNQFQKHKLNEKLEIFDPQLSEKDNMFNNGYNRVWDCGNNVYIWGDQGA